MEQRPSCIWFCVHAILLQYFPEEYSSAEKEGEHQSLALHLPHHLYATGPEHYSRLQHQRHEHQTVRHWTSSHSSPYLLNLLFLWLCWSSLDFAYSARSASLALKIISEPLIVTVWCYVHWLRPLVSLTIQVQVIKWHQLQPLFPL